MKFVTCKVCQYFENDNDEPFQCDCPKPKREKHWLEKVIERVREIESEEG